MTLTPLHQPEGSEDSLVVSRWWCDYLRKVIAQQHDENRRLRRELREARGENPLRRVA